LILCNPVKAYRLFVFNTPAEFWLPLLKGVREAFAGFSRFLIQVAKEAVMG